MKRLLIRTWVLFGYLVFGAAFSWAAPLTITQPVTNQTFLEDFGTTNLSIAFSYDPADGSPQLAASTSGTPSGLFSVTTLGSGSNQTVRLTSSSNLNGTNTVTLVATNSASVATNIFQVVVTPVNDPPAFTSPVSSPVEFDEDHSANRTFTIFDVDHTASSLTVTSVISGFPINLLQSVVSGGSGSNRTVVITPQANMNGTNQVQLIVSDGTLTDTNTFDVIVAPVDDPPLFTGVTDFAFPDSTGTTNLFGGVSIVDVDHERLLDEELLLTISIPPDSDAGTFDGPLSYTGNPQEVTAGIQGLGFTPEQNQLPVGHSNVLNITLSVEATKGSEPATVSNVQLTVESVNDAPSAFLDISPSLIHDTTQVQPFQLDISDPDLAETFTVSILAVNDPSGLFGTMSPVPTNISGTALSVENAVANIRYTPVEDVVSGSTNIDFVVIIEDDHGAIVTNSAASSLTILSANDAPLIQGVSVSSIWINDDQQVFPFPAVEISDPEQDNLTITISLDDPSLGTLSTNVFTSVAESNATALIRSVQFVPAGNVIPVGDTRSVVLTITVSDGSAEVFNNDTEIVITGVNGAPEITVPAIQPITVEPGDPRPFLAVSVSDETNDSLTLEIELDDDQKGSLSNQLSGVDGFTAFTGSVAEVNELLTNLVFMVNTNHTFPPASPGDTTFSISVEDQLGNFAEKDLRIVLQEFPRNILVTRSDDDNEPGSLRYALDRAANSDVITFAFINDFPVRIRLDEANGPITLRKHLTLKGPGADKLIISGDTQGDQIPDMQLFRIEAEVVMEGIALEYGTGMFGGAVSVGPAGGLTMRYCSVSDSIAQQWGGAIDVEEGWLVLENCLLQNNSTDPSLGYGGGAVSLYTDQDCRFINSTFSGNTQASVSGDGGGALYVENFTPSTYLNVDLIHCAFAENEDAALVASSVLVSGFGSRVWPQNTIFADAFGYNLDVTGTGEILSMGGNISDDSTYTVYTQGGSSQSVFLLDANSDQTDTDPLLGALADLEGPTAIYPLDPASPAINAADGAVTAIDQRGVIRHDGQPDCGAVEFAALQRILINEIQPNDNPDDLIEFYVPRDAVDIDLSGYELYVGDRLCHTFSNRVVKPGAGIIVADSTNVVANGPPPTPVVLPSVSNLNLGARGQIILKSPGAATVLDISYNDDFLTISNVFDSSLYSDHSQTLSPQFCGFAYLPHGRVGANASSAGFDTKPQAFGSPNASAVAVNDRFVVSEDEISWLDVLANDVDADRTDTLVVTGVPFPSLLDTTTNNAIYSVSTNASLLPDGVWYNPLTALNVQQLAEGAELPETFRYSISDLGTGAVAKIENAGGFNLLHTAEDHRLTTNDTVIFLGTGLYDGTNAVLAVLDDNTVEIDTTVTTPASNGVWSVFRSSDEADVFLTVLGVNDAPEPQDDIVACGEDDVLRILADPDLLTAGVVFETDADYPVTVDVAITHLLANDEDIDTDDDETTLHVVGVVQTSSDLGADIILEIRDDRAETSIVYNPRVSSILNGLAVGEQTNDTFRYIVMDRHGALGTATVSVVVSGVNDTPVGKDDPDNLDPLRPFVEEGGSVANVISNLTVLDAIGAVSGMSNRVDARVVVDGTGEADSLVVSNLWTTGEDDPLPIASSDILANDFDVDLSDELVISQVFFSQQGVPVFLTNGNATVLYDAPASATLNALARGELLMDSFEVLIDDQHLGWITNTVAVLVVGMNDTPVAINDTNGTPEDVLLVFDPIQYPTHNPLLWDFDVDTNGVPPDNAFWILPVTNEATPWLALFSISNNTVFYDPAVSAGPEGALWLDGLSETNTAVDTFSYTLTDQSLVFACDDLFRVEPDGAGFELAVLANDRNYNPRGGAVSILSVGLPNSGGMVETNGDATALIYTPETGFVGDEVFTYTITDPWGNIDRARVTVRVTLERVNGTIQANDDHFSAAVGEEVALDVLANDHRLPLSGTSFTLTQVWTNGLTGTVRQVGNALLYSNTNGAMTETFSYEVSAGGNASATASVTVRVINRNNKLPARDDCFSILRNSVNRSLDVLSNDRILPDSPDVFIRGLSTDPSFGTAVVTNNTLHYTPNAGFVGVDELGYIVEDRLGGTGYAAVRIFVGSLVSQDDAFTVPSDGTPVALDVLANDSVLPEGASGDISILGVSTQTVAIGTISNAIDHLWFTPISNQYGTATFTYEFQDKALANARVVQGSVTVTVVDPGAHANPDHAAVLEGAEEVLLDVLNNDGRSDPERTLAITGIGTGADAPNQGGVVEVSPEGDRLVYTPATDFTGEETFTYFMTDSLDTDSTRVIVQVRPPEMAACNDAYMVYFEGEDTPVFSLPVLLNDTLLPDDGILQIDGTGMDDPGGPNAPSENGYVEIASDSRSLEYTPDIDYSNAYPYVETFTYEISDGSERRAAATVSVQVEKRLNVLELETNDDRYSVHRNSASNRLAVLLNDGILPATASGWSIATLSACDHGGNVVLSGSSILFSPAPDFIGTDRFTYSVSDGLGGTASAEVHVKVGNILLNEDYFAVLSGTVSNAIPVLANDGVLPGPEFDYTLFAGIGASLGGTVGVAGDQLLYTPNLVNTNYPYIETLEYSVIDDSSLTVIQQVDVMVVETGSDRDTATVSIEVQGVNDLPVIINLAELIYTDDKTTIGSLFPTGTVYDVDEWYQEHLEVTITIDDPTKASLVNLGDFTNSTLGVYGFGGTGSNITASLRNLTFEPIENQFTVGTTGIVTLTIIVTDPFDGVATTVVDIRVIPINDPPIITGTRADQEVYHALAIKPFSSVTITEVDDLTLQQLTVQISLDDATHGVITSLGSFVDLGGGVYSATGLTRAEATAALRTLVFEPTTDGRLSLMNISETTRFTLSVDDAFAPPVTDDITTVTAMFGLMNELELWLNDSPEIREFGSAVGALRDWVVAGAHNSNVGGNNEGAVLIFSRNLEGSDAWGECKTIFPTDATGGDEFGYAVAMSGDTLVVGSPDNAGRGAAYVYQQNQGGSDNWGFVKKLRASDGSSGDFFGCSVAIDGDTIAIGDKDKEQVYLFNRHEGGSDEWSQVQIVNASDEAANRDFGYSVSLHGDGLIVGAPDDDTHHTDSGAAYLFERSGGAWNSQQKLYGAGEEMDYFGWSVDIYGDLLAVGAPRDGNAMGAAFVFANNGSDPDAPWIRERKLVASTRRSGDLYGAGVQIDRGLLVVGVEGFQIGSADDGEAYLYSRHEGGINQWGEVERFSAPVKNTTGTFGRAMALEDYTLAIGSSGGSVIDTVSIYRLKFNDAPAVATPISDQFADLFEPFSLSIPAETFADPDVEDALTLAASQGDGSSLASTWLSFDPVTEMFSGTPVVTGAVEILLIATDPDGESATNAFTVYTISTNGAVVLSEKIQWQTDYFGNDALGDPDAIGENWSDDSDPDGDGLSNISEYIFGTNPTNFGTVVDHQLVLVCEPALNQISVSYNRRVNDPTLVYVLEVTTDLQIWQDASPFMVGEISVPLADGMERVISIFGAPVASECYRVKVFY